MGFAVTEPREKSCLTKPTSPRKTASGDFFANPNRTRPANRRQPLKTQLGKPTYAYRIASGRPFWPSRDPIEEQGGENLYGMVRNDALNRWDVIGLAPASGSKCSFTVISANTTKDDAKKWKGIANNLITGVSSTAEMLKKLEERMKKNKCKCITRLDVSGHGYSGGVSWGKGKGGFHIFRLRENPEQLKKLKKMLCPDASIQLWSCSSASGKDNLSQLQALSDELGVRVSGIRGPCKSGPNGDVSDRMLYWWVSTFSSPGDAENQVGIGTIVWVKPDEEKKTVPTGTACDKKKKNVK